VLGGVIKVLLRSGEAVRIRMAQQVWLCMCVLFYEQWLLSASLTNGF
jgi:hypothetical protein